MKRDTEVAARIRAGLMEDRPEAIEVVRGWVAGMVYGAGWGLSDPDAAIQDVTLRVLRLARSGRIREDTDFKSFIMTVARHTCTDHYRRDRLRASIERSLPELELRPGRSSNPHDTLEDKERIELLRFIFQSLSEDCRHLWRWVYGEGLSTADVAARLGISPGNVRVRMYRCLQRARDIHRNYVLGEA